MRRRSRIRARSKGRITIPQEVRERLGIVAGTEVAIQDADGAGNDLADALIA